MKISRSSSSPKVAVARAPVISAKPSKSKVPSLKKSTVLASKGRIKDTNTSKVYKLSRRQQLSANKRIQDLRSGSYKIKPFKSNAKDDGKHGARFSAAKRHKILQYIQDPNTPSGIRGHYIQQIRKKGLSGNWSNPKGYDFGHKLHQHQPHREHRDHPNNIELQDSSRNRRIGAKYKK